MVQKIHELNEIGMLKIRNQISFRKFRLEQTQEFVDRIMEIIPVKVEQYKRMIEPSNDFDEISRRFAVLTPQFVRQTVEKVDATYSLLELSVSASVIMTEISSSMMRHAILIPTIERVNCVSVQQRLAGMVVLYITEKIDKLLQRVLNEFKIQQGGDGSGILLRDKHSSSSSSSSEGRKGRVRFADSMPLSVEGEIVEFTETTEMVDKLPKLSKKTEYKRKTTKLDRMVCFVI